MIKKIQWFQKEKWEEKEQKEFKKFLLNWGKEQKYLEKMGESFEEARGELASVFEDWVLLSIQKGDTIPSIVG